MINIQAFADKTAISLSFVCVVHCLAVPVLLVLLPSLMAFNLGDEAFHNWLLVAVVPASVLALAMGCKKHRQLRVLMLGGLGLAILLSVPVLGHDFLGETGEKILTLVGAMIIAVGHWFNHRLCQTSQCECEAESSQGLGS
ncbi:MAG: hypothetical protein AseanaTS_27260 [Candidatus Pelagadaptatus aseana]|uniref:MerC domain-containing protein n=1 Tax=Candidatus Pelagadaptatus aseana TaxID=3120508 RepID=UPI0039B15B38